MYRDLEIYVKVENLGSGFDLEKNCKKFNNHLSALEYIECIVGDGWSFAFNSFDDRCFAIQYIICAKDGHACGYYWIRQQCKSGTFNQGKGVIY